MGVIHVLTNPANLQDVQRFEHEGPLIDFLLREYPNGFPGPAAVLRNLDRWAVEDFDQPVGDALVTLAIQPQGPAVGAFFVKYVVPVLISMVLSYAINALFGPKGVKPNAPNVSRSALPSPESVYSFSGDLNNARIGQVVPVAYGRNLMSPDLAMQPYVYFEGNEQYLVMLLCLGQGHFTIHDVFVAGTNVNVFGDDVVQVDWYPPEAHRETFGVIQSETGRYENLYTSPAVSDLELHARKAVVVNGNYVSG